MANEYHPQRRERSRGVVELVVACAAIVVVVTVGALIAGPGRESPLALDSAWAALMTSDRTTVGVAAASALAVVGGTVVMWVLSLVSAAILLVFRRVRAAVTLLASISLASIASPLLKALIARPRPPARVEHLSGYSYPSGHTTIAAAVVTALALIAPRVWSWTLGATWVVVIAWSRTYLGVHWLTDVVAGAVLGAAVAVLLHGALRVLWISAGDRR